MERGAYKPIVTQFVTERVRLRRIYEKAVNQSHEEERRVLHDLEEDCLREHGAHEDNGGFMYGHCTRCGASLE